MATALAGKVIAVTGAGRGIGREVALLCAREDASLVVNDYGASPEGEGADTHPAHQVVHEITGAGGRAVANTASIADPAGAQSIIDDAIRSFGQIDAVVNNAGILRDRIFHKMSIPDWQSVVDVNLNGYFYVSKAAASHFRDRGSGSYVHLTSASALIGNLGQANYSAAKLGVVALSNSIALDMERFGVRSNCVMPFAWSRLTATIPTDTEEGRRRVERVKAMTPAKVAPLIAFLCTDASKGITGQVLSVRKDEVFLMSRPDIMRSMHRASGWTIESLAQELYPAFKLSFHPLRRSSDVFSWDPI
jgi:NAD(P)-dependent dehydrogenase (short-subunit alcohol dehydrogenase family)